jgi:exopolysaccharide biosynthesis polyprenyl glycosylphosphotransferase
MKRKDTADVLAGLRGIVADALAVFGGFMLAIWIRFDSGWLEVEAGRPPSLYFKYGLGSLAATVVFLFVFKSLQLYVRPQTGRFENKIPRLMRAMTWGLLITTALAFLVRDPAYPEYSRLTLALAFCSTVALVLLERYLLFRLELHEARHSATRSAVLLVGTDEVAARLAKAIRHEPRLRTRVAGFVATNGETAHAELGEPVKGRLEDLERLLTGGGVDQLIVCDTRLDQHRILDILLLCERHLVTFHMVPDLFRIMTGSVDMQTVGDVPLLGVSRWPLDFFWNRLFKRIEDVLGGLAGLIVSLPVIAVAAVLIKRASPGPVFYRQIRCGEAGRTFTLYKLRTMPVDAEAGTGPVWATPGDRRRTPVGAFLRAHNLDELPQFWNVLKGDMSLVGPRPERPHFVEQFKADIQHYMWRHVSKPGMTGWAQVNGLRGDTSIEERIRYDLYYLEKWSLSMDFKILIKTLFARENAY